MIVYGPADLVKFRYSDVTFHTLPTTDSISVNNVSDTHDGFFIVQTHFSSHIYKTPHLKNPTVYQNTIALVLAMKTPPRSVPFSPQITPFCPLAFLLTM